MEPLKTIVQAESLELLCALRDGVIILMIQSTIALTIYLGNQALNWRILQHINQERCSIFARILFRTSHLT
jgi:hypothetical protein